MNKYNFSNTAAGGIETFYDDFEFEQNAVREAFEGIIRGIGNNNNAVILQGCVKSNVVGGINITDGWIAINGEVCRHDNTTYPDFVDGGSDGVYWYVNEVNDSGGTKTAAITSATVETWKVRKAKCNGYSGSVPSGGVDDVDVVSLGSALWAILNDVQQQWISCVLDSHWGLTSGGIAKYRITNDGYLEFYADVKMNSAGSVVITTLPSGYRPNKRHIVTGFELTGNDNVNITILTGGNVAVTSGAGTASVGDEFNIHFKIPLVI